MRRISFKRGNLKSIISLLVLFGLIFGCVGVIAAVRSNDMKTVSSFEFDMGSLDENGDFARSKTTLVNKSMFECQGLEIEKDFESFATYEIFYYRIDKSFIGRSGVQTGDYAKDQTFYNAAYARVVITPKLEDKEEISFWNKYELAGELKIKVLKDQSFDAPTEKLLAGVRDKFAEKLTSITYHTVRIEDGPFVLENLDLFENRTITKISVPVAGVIDAEKDSTFTVYVVNGGANGFKKVQEHKFTVPAGTYKDSLGKVDSNDNQISDVENIVWIEFDCNISLKDGETLAFGSTSDSVYTVYRKTFSEGENHYNVYNDALYTPGLLKNLSVYVDVESYE